MTATAALEREVRSAPTEDWRRRLRALIGGPSARFLPLESTFLETGRRLASLSGEVSRLTSEVEGALSVFSRDETRRTLSELVEVAGRIDAMRARGGSVGETLRRMTEDADAVIGSLGALRGIMRQVKVVAINARIESSQLTRSTVDFSIFTRDIARLADGGDRTVEEVALEVSRLRTAAVEARDLQRGFEAEALPRLDALAEQLAVSVRDLREAEAKAERGARGIPTRLRACGQVVAKLVAALQIYDATRQRLEHIDEALELTIARLAGGDPTIVEERGRRVLVNAVAELQALQLKYADDHYHETTNEVGREVATITAEIPRLDEACRRAFGAGEEDTLSVVERDLARGGEILAAFISIRTRAAASLDRVAAAATRAGDLIMGLNRISADMRLMSLNATIKCGNMGSVGRVLSVIAQDLQGHADHTRERVRVVADALGRVSIAARDTAEVDRERVGKDDPASLKTTIDRLGEGLRATGGELTRALEAVVARGAAATNLARELGEGFREGVDCRKAMGETRDGLEALAREADTGLSGSALERERRAALSFMEDRYTMVGERSVHDMAVESRSTGGRTDSRADDADVDDFLL